MDGHIELYGLRLFGRLNSNYSVNLELINEESGEKVLSQTGNFTSIPLKTYGGSEYFGFEFLFDQPVNIDTVTKYRVEALISGPSSEKAKNCYRNTDWFTFSAYDNENNGTDAREGQFPEFVFRRHRLDRL